MIGYIITIKVKLKFLLSTISQITTSINKRVTDTSLQ